MKPQADGFEVRSVTDVRKIHACLICTKIGMHRHGMVRVCGKRNARGAIRDARYARAPQQRSPFMRSPFWKRRGQ